MEELTQEQLDAVIIKVDEELELYVIRNYVDEISKNLRISLKRMNERYK